MNGYRRVDKDSDLVGTFTPSGLHNEGRITHDLTIDTTWKPAPTTPLTDRNGIQIINREAAKIVYLEFDNGVATGEGIPIAPGGFWAIDITDAIPVYLSVTAGTAKVTIVEVS